MKNYITVQQINDNIDFVNLAITLSNVDSKSREDMKVVCKDGNFNIENLTSNIQIHSNIVNKIDKNNKQKQVFLEIFTYIFQYFVIKWNQ